VAGEKEVTSAVQLEVCLVTFPTPLVTYMKTAPFLLQ
jgi:hypothetical protein